MKKFLAILLAIGFASTAALAADFGTVDADQNGSVTVEEAKAAMPELSDDAFKAADGDQNGELSAEEFANIQG
jgi:Ca2+-binding EF-hand superfamily protein